MRAEQTGRWTRLRIDPKQKRISAVWHRVAGESTVCGLLIGDREVPGQPPAGAKLCRHCEVLS